MDRKVEKEELNAITHKLQETYNAMGVLLMVVTSMPSPAEEQGLEQARAQIGVACTEHMRTMLPAVLHNLASDIKSRNIDDGLKEPQMSHIVAEFNATKM